MTHRNLGIFAIDRNLIMDSLGEVLEVFTFMNLVVVRAEMLFQGTIEYTGISDLFKEIPDGGSTPHYTLEIIKNESGSVIRVRAVKV